MSFKRGGLGETVFLGMVLILQLWLAHTLAYLAHEYAHSFVAWGLGYKGNPLALDYGHPTWDNIIFLSDVDENVNYDPIFSAGRGGAAALIAVSGVLFGNGIFYLVSRRLYFVARTREKRLMALFMFLLCMMNVGNFISYVPNRTFTTHADMATVERGLNLSPWWIAVVLGIPFCVALWHFFARILPDAVRFLFPDERVGKIGLVVMTAYVVCEFFGRSGFRNYGGTSHWIAAAWVYALFPAIVILCWPRDGMQTERAISG
jgi:hypothetical protein